MYTDSTKSCLPAVLWIVLFCGSFPRCRLPCVIVVFLDHTHFLSKCFILFSVTVSLFPSNICSLEPKWPLDPQKPLGMPSHWDLFRGYISFQIMLFSVIYYVSNTIILYFIVHCIYVFCLFSARHASVNLLRQLLWPAIKFCSVLYRFIFRRHDDLEMLFTSYSSLFYDK